MNIHNRINYCMLSILLLVFSTQSCVLIEKQLGKLKLENNRSNTAILRLCNYGDIGLDSYKQSEKLTNGHLFRNDGEEYGYYVIKYDIKHFGTVAYLRTKLYIFDSYGQLIKEYEDSSRVKKIAGLYYGHNEKKKVEQKYSELYEGIFDVATSEASEINYALKKVGAINEQNEKIAQANIEAFFKDKGGAYKKNAGFHSNARSQANQASNQNNLTPQTQEKKPLRISDFNQGLEIGKYYCVEYKNLSIQMFFGIFTLKDGNRDIAVGNYKSHGNKLVVSFYEGEFKGQVYTYIIDDSKHFHHSASEENWVHESVQ